MNVKIKDRKAYSSGPSKVLSIPKIVWESLEQKHGKNVVFDLEVKEDGKYTSLTWTVKESD